MKKQTIPNEPEEVPLQPDRQEIKQPVDPKEPELPQKEIEEVPPELPPPAIPAEAPKQ